jgi:hypothetical protein
MLEMRTDFDIALAWNALDFMSLGATAHFPRQRSYLARDVDSVLTGADADGNFGGRKRNYLHRRRRDFASGFDGKSLFFICL